MTSNLLEIYDYEDPDRSFVLTQKSAGDLDSMISSARLYRRMDKFVDKLYCFHMTGFLELEENWSDEERKLYKSKKKHTFRLGTMYYAKLSSFNDKL